MKVTIEAGFKDRAALIKFVRELMDMHASWNGGLEIKLDLKAKV